MGGVSVKGNEVLIGGPDGGRRSNDFVAAKRFFDGIDENVAARPDGDRFSGFAIRAYRIVTRIAAS